mmetsp:Transcript_17892/g.29032  ORF Transcript_17892/g.29032 Transcript_17892/m.29032 type:complete len:244 (-) Transcript_17892:911-1642(-)
MVALVFDFDWSLINENSDTFLFKELGEDVYHHLKNESSKGRGQWTRLVDESLVLLQQKHNVSLGEIKKCIEDIPVLVGMLEIVREFAAKENGRVYIVSDANEYFISSFLEKHALVDHVAQVKTNKSWVCKDTGMLRIGPYVDEPHSCELCPPNMCKGDIMETLGLVSPGSDKIFYVGDGGGDFCPAIKLRENDVLFVRNDSSYPSARGLVNRIDKKKDSHPVKANIVHWKTSSDITDELRKHF